MKHYVSFFILICGVLGCDPTPLPKFERVVGPDQLDFICMDNVSGEPAGPVDSCGCNEATDTQGEFRTLGPVECLCVTNEGEAIARVVAEECAEGICPVRGDDGDFMAADASASLSLPCVRRGKGNIAALIGSTEQKSIDVMFVDQPGLSNKLFDSSRRIPSQNGHYVDDLLVGLHAYEPSNVYFGVLGFSSRLAIFNSAKSVEPDNELALAVEPVVESALWFNGSDDLDFANDGLFVLGHGRDTVYEFMLDATVLAGGMDTLSHSACYTLSQSASPSCRVVSIDGLEGEEAFITKIAVSPDGERLVFGLGHREQAIIVERGSGNPALLIDWSQTSSCDDTFLFDPSNACQIRDDCFVDGDVNGDGQIDISDSACPLSGYDCFDGVDNDVDGLIDRNDPGCTSMVDGSEVDREVNDLCENGLDDDLDGLVDQFDPGCESADVTSPFDYERLPACGDGVDNDQDGSTDYVGGDDGCSHAGDASEGAASQRSGLRELSLGRAPRFGSEVWQISAVDYSGQLHMSLVSEDTIVGQAGVYGEDIQLIDMRTTTSSSSNIALGWDGSVSVWTFGRYVEARVGGFQLFGARPTFTSEDAQLWSRIQSGYGGGFDPLYIVDFGVAKTHPELEGVCASLSCEVAADCPIGGECLSGICVASNCDETACVEGAVCQGNVCLQECSSASDCRGHQTCQQGRCVNPCSASSDGQFVIDGALPAIDDLNWKPIELVEKGASDSSLYIRVNDLTVGEPVGKSSSVTNLIPRLTGVPSYSTGGQTVTFDPGTTLFFCDVFADGLNSDDTACLPAGYDSDGGVYRLLSPEEKNDKFPMVLSAAHEVGINFEYRNLTQRETDYYVLQFEGEIPGTQSRFGRHGGMSGDGWLLVDPKANFCEAGVKAGDVVVVDKFRRGDDFADECGPWLTPPLDGPPVQRLEPLRYRVTTVGARSLVLERDGRTAYHQRARSSTQVAPRPAEAPELPPESCVQEGFSYHVRVGDNQWLAVTGSEGYRHPWVDQGGTCVQSPARPEESRFMLGELFDDGLVRFQLSFAESDEECDGLPCMPYLIDTVVSFGISSPNGHKGGRLALGAASEMRWSRFDDSLYVLDPTNGTVVQVKGFDSSDSVYREVRRLE